MAEAGLHRLPRPAPGPNPLIHSADDIDNPDNWSSLVAPRKPAQGFIALAIVILGLSAPGHAMDFKSGNTDTNSYYYDGTSAGNWSFNVVGGTRTGDWWSGCTGQQPNGDFECVESVNDNSVTIYGGGQQDTEITWTSAAGINLNPPATNGTSYIVTFDATYIPDTGSNSDAFYRVTDLSNNTTTTTYFTSLSNQQVAITYNQTLTFGIRNDSLSGYLEVRNFSYKAVPAPIPAVGAATAFGYSRRLRRRIKGKRSSNPCPPVMPPHPAAYLNLHQADILSLPVSFSYDSAQGSPASEKKAA